MTTNGDDAVEVVPVRHVGRYVSAGVVLVLLAMLVHTLLSKVPTGQVSCHVSAGVRVCRSVSNWRFSWNIVFHYFTSRNVLSGLLVTLELTVIAMAIGIILGMLIAIMRLSHNRLVSSTAWVYTWFFRGTPVYVQLLFWFAAGYLFPTFTIGVPFGPALFHIDLNATLTPMVAASIGLSLNEGAYMSEIVRAGIVSVDEGQLEAAQTLGMSRLKAMRLVVLPQAMRVIIPPTGNETISMLKTSALASVVTVPELLFAVEQIAAANYKTVPLYIDASIWYLVVTTVMMVGQYYLERYYARGSVRQLPPTPWQQIRSGAFLRPGRGRYGRFPGVIGGEWAPVLAGQDEGVL